MRLWRQGVVGVVAAGRRQHVRPAAWPRWAGVFLLAAAWWVAGVRGQEASESAALTIDGRAYAAVRTARHDSYDVTLVLRPPEGAERFERVDLVIAGEGAAAGLRFVWDREGHALGPVGGGAAAAEWFRSGPGLPDSFCRGGTLVLRRRPWVFEVVADGTRVMRVLDATPGRGRVALASGPGLAVAAEARYQKIEPIEFGDDFMRTEEETKDFGLWQPQGGEWRLYSVMELIRANPDARIREGHGPDASHSVNPFCLSGRSPDGAMILTGFPFWSDYEVAVSAKTTGGQFGLVFGAVGADVAWVVRWELLTSAVQEGRLELVRREGGRETVVAATALTGRTDNWYRLAVRTVGSRIDVLVDRVPVLQHWSEQSVGGRIGLYARSRAETFFDDVEAKSWTPIRFDDAALVQAHPGALPAEWSVGGQRGQLSFVPRPGDDGRERLYVLGAAGWRDVCLQARLEPAAGAEGFGLAFALRERTAGWRCRWSRQEGGRVALTRVRDGREETVVQAPLALPPGEAHEWLVDLREAGLIRLYVDGELWLRQRADEDLSGAVGLCGGAGGQVTFGEVEAFGNPARDWEQSVRSAIFAEDPYMQGWSSPRWAWLPVRDNPRAAPGTQTFEHKGDFYGAFTFSAPISHGLTVLFGADLLEADAGYRLEVSLRDDRRQGTVALWRVGERMAAAGFELREKTVIAGEQIIDEKIGALPKAADTVSYGMLRVAREGRYVTVTVDDREVLAVREANPLDGRCLGLEVRESLDLGRVTAQRDHVKDYLFESAPVDWQKVGTWEVTNRFACDPRWSHMNARSKGVAALWSKFGFEGDFTIEYYAGMQMRQNDMREASGANYYPRVGDINLALCADGHDLFSGYNLILSAWDPGWSERWTQFRRLGEVVEKTDKELIPRTRDARPQARAVEVDWDPGGRPIHGAWYHIKVRHSGGRFDVYFDGMFVFSYTDDEPLAGRQFALWTQHNSIVIARALIGYRRASAGSVRLHDPARGEPVLPAAAAPAAAVPATPLPVLRCPSHPGVLFDFEDGLAGWTSSPGEDQGADLAVVPGSAGRAGHVLKLRNRYAGGDFGAVVPLPPLDLGRVARLEFDCAIPPETKVTLCFTLQDEPCERYFLALSGPAEDAPNLVSLGRCESVVADGRWHHVSVDLGRRLREKLPERGSFPLGQMLFGQVHEGYLVAGLGGNPEGAVYSLDNVEVVSVGPASARFAWEGAAAPAGDVRVLLSRAAAADGAGAEACAGGEFRRDVAEPGLWYAHAFVGGDRQSAVRRTVPLWVAPPLAVTAVEPAAGAAWGGQPIVVRFAPAAAAFLDVTRLKLTANDRELRVDSVAAVYDPRRQTLTVDPAYTDVSWKDGETVRLALAYRDGVADESPGQPAATDKPAATDGPPAAPAPAAPAPAAPLPPPAPPGPPPPVPPGTGVQDLGRGWLGYSWECRVSYREDQVGPARVRLAPALYPSADFEDGLSGVTHLTSGPHLRLARTVRADAERGHALRLTNALCGADFGIAFDMPAFNLGRFPILSFDYRVTPDVHADFLLACAAAPMAVTFTDRNNTENQALGAIADVRADDAWHHAEIDMRQALETSNTGFSSRRYDVRRLSFGDWGYTAMAPGVSAELDNVALVPVVSTTDGYTLTWSARDPSGVTAYSYLWSADAEAKVDKTPETTACTEVFADLPDGELYFHIRGRDGAENWGPVSRYRYRVDNVAPVVRAVTPAADEHAAAPTVSVRFLEAGSGIDPSTIGLSINGTPCALSSVWTTWNSERQEFSWNWVDAKRVMRSVVPDGQAMACRLSGVTDFGGNLLAPYEWTWQVAHAADKEGPQAPRVFCYTHKLLQADDFSGGPGHWLANARMESASEVTTEVDPDTGDRCLVVRKTADDGGRFGCLGFRGQWDPATYPLVGFDYKIAPGANVNLIVFVNEAWHYIRMTGDDSLPQAGELPGVVADGKWHQAVLNIDEVLRQALPGTPKIDIRHLGIGNWQSRGNRRNSVGATFSIDNFAILGPGSPLPEVYASACDATGISALSFSLDRNPRGVPPAAALAPTEVLDCPAIDEPGLWYVHVRARDGAGNDGRVAHYPYYCPNPVPASEPDGLEAADGWRTLGLSRGTYATLRTLRTAHGDRSLLLWSVRTWREDEVRLALKGDVKLAGADGLTADLFLPGKLTVKVAAYLRREEGGKPIVSTPVEVPPDTWLRGVAFAFPKEALAATAGATPGVFRECGLVLYAPARLSARLVVDGLRPAPQVQAALAPPAAAAAPAPPRAK